MLNIAKNMLVEAQERQKTNMNKRRQFCKLKEEKKEPLKNLENCGWLVDDFKKKLDLSLSSEKYREIDYLKCNSYNDCDSCDECNLYNDHDDHDNHDNCSNDYNDHNDHDKHEL
ncbi:15403_t:CDS:2 [Racocetra persica]|uniref:15403_t:CDS:1 n=1 Tax=Racocetra persica TaxID=160502 RepID=A0ACA9L8N0_9GLOM|nr:15403_t:CDS:2 [Racocetra persica]